MVPAFLWACLLATLAALCAHAAPTSFPSHQRQLVARQKNAPFNGPQTVQTRNVTKVTGGNIVKDCTNVFTPIVVNGENLVREESTCTEIFVPDGHTIPPPPPSNTTLPPTSTTTIPPNQASTTNQPPPPPATTNTPPPATTDSPAPLPPATTDTTPPAGPTPDPTNSQPANSNTGPVLGPPPGTAEGQNSPTGSSATSAPSDGVNIPGKELQVLPIGLGVFAGISVIALIVVGLVTYERTKYRKAFRQRRLAATGAEMGYGGMSERR